MGLYGQWLLIENLKPLKRYLRAQRAEGKSEKTRETVEHTVTHFLTWCGYRKVETFTDEDVYDWIDYIDTRTYVKKGVTCECSKATICKEKTIIKKFLASVKEELGATIKLKAPKNELPEIFNEEEVNKLVNAATTPRDKMAIAVAYESGARRGELLSCRLRHVTFDEFGAVLSLPVSKTKPRKVRLVWSASFLRQWLDCHPLRDNKEAFLFCSLHKPHGVITTSGLHYQLKIIAERAGIDKDRAYLHNLRHSRATHLSNHLTESQLKVQFGWTPSSTVTGVYVHLSGADADRAILKMHGLVTDPDKKLDIIKCPRCKEIQDSKTLYCWKCGYPLHDDGVKILEKESDEFEMMFLKLTAEYPELLKSLDKYKKND